MHCIDWYSVKKVDYCYFSSLSKIFSFLVVIFICPLFFLLFIFCGLVSCYKKKIPHTHNTVHLLKKQNVYERVEPIADENCRDKLSTNFFFLCFNVVLVFIYDFDLCFIVCQLSSNVQIISAMKRYIAVTPKVFIFLIKVFPF